jgi:hypothetical protein
MKKTINFLFIIIATQLSAQNVGIGNPTPAEKLDVAGNINLTGTIKANGVDGTAGQFLMKNSSGLLNWGDAGNFKNVAAFTDTLNSFIGWNVPAGITKIWVELWGGGGAGLFTGGGGGGYMSLLFNVTPAQFLQITVGKGGRDLPTVSGTLTYNQGGGDSRIDISGQYYIASGGGGGTTSTFFTYPQYTPGIGGGYLTSVSGTTSPRGPFYAQSGQPGDIFRYQYNSISSNQYYRLAFYGNGGAAANTGNYTATAAYEEYSFIISPASNTRTIHNPARSGNFPGGGGGGGPQLVNDARLGANGLVLIHY